MSNEIIIAIIGAIGVLITALLSNWEKLFPRKDKVIAKVIGYRPTNNFETELRHYINVSGMRLLYDSLIDQIIFNIRIQLIQQYPEDATDIDEYSHELKNLAFSIDEVIKKLMPIYQKYFSIQELQELNKFYSTEIMQNLVRKNKELATDIAPIQLQLQEVFRAKLNRLMEEKFG